MSIIQYINLKNILGYLTYINVITRPVIDEVMINHLDKKYS